MPAFLADWLFQFGNLFDERFELSVLIDKDKGTERIVDIRIIFVIVIVYSYRISLSKCSSIIINEF